MGDRKKPSHLVIVKIVIGFPFLSHWCTCLTFFNIKNRFLITGASQWYIWKDMVPKRATAYIFAWTHCKFNKSVQLSYFFFPFFYYFETKYVFQNIWGKHNAVTVCYSQLVTELLLLISSHFISWISYWDQLQQSFLPSAILEVSYPSTFLFLCCLIARLRATNIFNICYNKLNLDV